MMARVRLILVLWILFLATALPSRATSPGGFPAGGAPGEPAEDNAPTSENVHKHWKYYLDLPLPAKGPSGVYDFIVPPVVLDHKKGEDTGKRSNIPVQPVPMDKEPMPGSRAELPREGLNDLRLIDGNGREVPYAVRVRRANEEQHPLPAGSFNPITTPNHQAQVRLDIGPAAHHNAIEVRTSDTNFRRKVLIEGSDDNNNWAVIKEDELLAFAADGQKIDVKRIHYPDSRWHYLRVTVSPDPGKVRDEPRLESVAVFHPVVVPSEDSINSAKVGPRQALPTDLGPGSAWNITFDGLTVPCTRLIIDVAEKEFDRPYQVQLATGQSTYEPLYQDVWRRDGRSNPKPLEVKLPREVDASRFRFVITDSRNAPLTVTEVKYAAPARQVIFPSTDRESKEWKAPLKLYFANAEAAEPRYDSAADLLAKIKPPPTRIDLASAERHTNPDYQAPPAPFTERYPWLVYVVLGAASLVLLAIIAVLANQALKRTPPVSATP